MLLSLALLAASMVVPHAALATPSSIDRLEASVNASLILTSDVERFKKTVSLRAQLDPLFVGSVAGTKGANASTQEVVDFLIEERLIALTYPATDTETDQAINQIQSENRLSRSSLKEALQEQGFSFDDYFELIRMSVSKKNLVETDIRTKVSVTDDDVKNFYFNKFNRDTKAPRTYSFQMISVLPSDFKSSQSAHEVLERALREIKAGEAFDEVAKRITDGAGDGSLAKVPEDQLSSSLKAEMEKMKIGELSGVLGTPNSQFFVIRLVDVTAGDDERYQKIKEDIRNQLAASEYQHQISLWLDRKKQNAFIHKAGEPTLPAVKKAKVE